MLEPAPEATMPGKQGTAFSDLLGMDWSAKNTNEGMHTLSCLHFNWADSYVQKLEEDHPPSLKPAKIQESRGAFT